MTGLHSCAWCSETCDGACPYVLGAVRGHLCGPCARSLEDVVTDWAARRQKEQRKAALVLAEQRRREHALELEGLPGAMRRALKKRGEAA